MRFILFTCPVFMLLSCGNSAPEKTQEEIQFDNAVGIFKTNEEMFRDVYIPHDPAQRDSMIRRTDDMLRMDYTAFVSKYKIRDESAFLKSLTDLADLIKLTGEVEKQIEGAEEWRKSNHSVNESTSAAERQKELSAH